MIYYLPNNSVVKVHDIFDPLPEFMLRADIIFTDIPYNQAMLTSYSNKQDVTLSPKNTMKFSDFTLRLFDCMAEINPELLFIEVGKEVLADYIIESKKLFKYVTFYNSTYYHKKENKSYIIHATNSFKQKRFSVLEDKDEEDIIKWICKNCSYTCIGDLCMGTGLVGMAAYSNKKSFVGTELNKRRLDNLIQKLHKKDAKIKKYLY